MKIYYLVVITLLIFIYYRKQTNFNEKFIDNIFSHVFETNEKPYERDLQAKNIEHDNLAKPVYLPHKINNYFYCGKLIIHPYYEKSLEAYLYGKPIEAVHNLYSYYVFIIENEKIERSFPLSIRRKIKYGDNIFIRDGPERKGPFILK